MAERSLWLLAGARQLAAHVVGIIIERFFCDLAIAASDGGQAANMDGLAGSRIAPEVAGMSSGDNPFGNHLIAQGETLLNVDGGVADAQELGALAVSDGCAPDDGSRHEHIFDDSILVIVFHKLLHHLLDARIGSRSGTGSDERPMRSHV